MITKIALDVMALRRIVKDHIAPKFIRYGKNNRGLWDTEYHMPRAKPFNKTQWNRISYGLGRANRDISLSRGVHPSQIASISDIHEQLVIPQLKNVGVYNDTPKHVRWGGIGNKMIHRLKGGKMTGESNRTFNDMLALHENTEMQQAKKYFQHLDKPDSKLPSFASHFTPDVVLQEHNALSTLSGAKPETLNQVKDAFKHLRDYSGEKEILDSLIPGGYATGPRINRRYRRHLSDKWINAINQ